MRTAGGTAFSGEGVPVCEEGFSVILAGWDEQHYESVSEHIDRIEIQRHAEAASVTAGSDQRIEVTEFRPGCGFQQTVETAATVEERQRGWSRP